MIIVSKNRLCVVNFDTVNAIYIKKYCAAENYGIICDTNNGGDDIVLGTYNTKEECQNVFDKIIHDLNVNLIVNKNHIIYMPQSGELNED